MRIPCATALVLSVLGSNALFAADAPGKPPCDGHRKEKLERFDANHDGKLDDGEKAAARAALAERLKTKHPELFAKIDTNHDGALSEDEMKAAREELKALRQQHHQHKGGNAGGAPAAPAQ